MLDIDIKRVNSMIDRVFVSVVVQRVVLWIAETSCNEVFHGRATKVKGVHFRRVFDVKILRLDVSNNHAI